MSRDPRTPSDRPLVSDDADGERGRPLGATAGSGRRRRGGFPWWLLGLLALALVAVAAVLALGGGDDDDGGEAGGGSLTATTPAEAAAGETTGTGPGEGAATGTDTGGGGTDGAAGTDTAAGADTAGADGATGAGDVAGGALRSGDADLLAGGAATDLAPYTGQPAEGEGVEVQSVVSDEGFWVGPSEADRVFVVLDIEGESPFQVAAGQTVDLQGTVEPLPTGESFGVTGAEGLDQLRAAGHFVSASSIELRS